MQYQINPKNFNPKFEVAGCIIEFDEKIILLKRKEKTLQGNKWGLPSGKIEKNETLQEAIVREIFEETGIKIKKNKLHFIKRYNVRHDNEQDFVYHLFFAKLQNKKKIKLNKKEHKKAIWVAPKKALELDLVDGTQECIEELYDIK